MMARKTGLGKGLDALIPRGELNTFDEAVRRLPIERILPNPRQPRLKPDTADIEELSASIRQHGILQPLLVRPGPEEAQFTLIAGERRLVAARLAGLETVPVVIRPATDEEQLELALIENLQRSDLSPLETAQAYHHLIEDFGLSHDEVARKVGKSRVSITNTLRLLNLAPPVQQALAEGKISEGHARAILGLNQPQAQLAALETILKNEMNVRQAEDLVRKLTGIRAAPSIKASPPAEIQDIEARLRTRLGTRVSLRQGPKGGRLVIYYYSDEELQTLITEILNE